MRFENIIIIFLGFEWLCQSYSFDILTVKNLRTERERSLFGLYKSPGLFLIQLFFHDAFVIEWDVKKA